MAGLKLLRVPFKLWAYFRVCCLNASARFYGSPLNLAWKSTTLRLCEFLSLVLRVRVYGQGLGRVLTRKQSPKNSKDESARSI